MLDLQYESCVDVLNSPPTPPPRRTPGAAHFHRQSVSWSLGRSIFLSLVRLGFEFYLGLVLDPFWNRLGLLLPPFWEPKSGQVWHKMCLEPSFVRKSRFARNSYKTIAKTTFLIPRRVQDRLKTGPRRAQEG